MYIKNEIHVTLLILVCKKALEGVRCTNTAICEKDPCAIFASLLLFSSVLVDTTYVKVGSKTPVYNAPAAISNFSWFDPATNDASKNPYQVIMPYADYAMNHTFYYRQKHTVTVNYLDNRTEAAIKAQKKYIVCQGQNYKEAPPTIKATVGGTTYTYQYLKETGSAQSGTTGPGNIMINYYYQLPLIQAKMKQVQIYTAPATNGLPVEVQLLKMENYDEMVADMNNSNKTISIGLL